MGNFFPLEKLSNPNPNSPRIGTIKSPYLGNNDRCIPTYELSLFLYVIVNIITF